MKQLVFVFLLAFNLCACNSSDQSTTKEDQANGTKESNDTTSINYAYTIDHPDQWEIGTRHNTQMVLASLKNWEKGNMEATMKDFADSVEIHFDGLDVTLPKDSVKKMFENDRNQYQAVQIIMDDFESVVSKDRSKEYVSLWYKQKWQDLKGKWDSLSTMDDLRIKNGKIVSIDQKTRHFSKTKM